MVFHMPEPVPVRPCPECSCQQPTTQTQALAIAILSRLVKIEVLAAAAGRFSNERMTRRGGVTTLGSAKILPGSS